MTTAPKSLGMLTSRGANGKGAALGAGVLGQEGRGAVVDLHRLGVPVLDRLHPAQEVGGLQVGVEGGLVAVDLIQTDARRVLLVLHHVEAEAARLIKDG